MNDKEITQIAIEYLFNDPLIQIVATKIDILTAIHIIKRMPSHRRSVIKAQIVRYFIINRNNFNALKIPYIAHAVDVNKSTVYRQIASFKQYLKKRGFSLHT